MRAGRVGAELGWQRLLMHMTSLQGVFNLSDACRLRAKEGIEELKLLGIRTAMLTGDCLTAAVLVQDQLEDALDEVRAELLPEDKATIIHDLKNEGTVAMIGDGMNDAPALATADIGISMGISGSALATETGDMIGTSKPAVVEDVDTILPVLVGTSKPAVPMIHVLILIFLYISLA